MTNSFLELILMFVIVKDNPHLAKKGSAAVYGMAAELPVRSVVKDFLIEFFSEVYTH